MYMLAFELLDSSSGDRHLELGTACRITFSVPELPPQLLAALPEGALLRAADHGLTVKYVTKPSSVRNSKVASRLRR